jgi:hypothetical protein
MCASTGASRAAPACKESCCDMSGALCALWMDGHSAPCSGSLCVQRSLCQRTPAAQRGSRSNAMPLTQVNTCTCNRTSSASMSTGGLGHLSSAQAAYSTAGTCLRPTGELPLLHSRMHPQTGAWMAGAPRCTPVSHLFHTCTLSPRSLRPLRSGCGLQRRHSAACMSAAAWPHA